MEKPPEGINESSQQENRIEKIVTHEGFFHTDEVFATAILKDLFPESMELKDGGKADFVKYLRTRDKGNISRYKESPSTLLTDVGGEYDFENFNMDHHQIEGAGARENGIKYAAAGLVWKHFGKEWIKYVDVYSRRLNMSEEEIDFVWGQVDETYVQFFDSSDTGQMESITCELKDGTELNGKPFSFSEIIRLYNIDVGDGSKHQKRFDLAVEVMRTSMLSIAYKYMQMIEGLRKFNLEKCEFISNGRAVIINQDVGSEVSSYVLDKQEEFKKVEYYAVRNFKDNYTILVAPVERGQRKYRNPNAIPVELRLADNVEEINKLIGVEKGVIFSHTAGFMASCKDLETARKFLEYCTK